jgi:hypothetical protein
MSDPDDQAIVLGIRCRDGRRGTWAAAYGPGVGPFDAEVLRRLDA